MAHKGEGIPDIGGDLANENKNELKFETVQ